MAQFSVGANSLDEIYLPLDLWETFDEDDDASIDEQVVGHVTVEKDPPGDRVYWGHRISVEATVTVERLGRRLFGDVELEVTHAKLRWFDEEPA